MISDINAELHAWAVAASGLPSGSVIWAYQHGRRPDTPYMTVSYTAASRGLAGRSTRLSPAVVADTVIESVDAGADSVTITAHGRLTGDGPFRLVSSGSIPGGLAADTDYWLVAQGPDDLSLAASHLDAWNAATVDITDAGSGTHSLVDTPDTLLSGAEIADTVIAHREISIELRTYSSDVGVQPGTAMEILSRVELAHTRPAVSSLLGLLSLGAFGPILNVTAIIGEHEMESRAAMDVVGYAVDTDVQGASYVEHAGVVGG